MLSKKQQEIVDCEDDIIFVEASASSGKTTVIIEKIRKEIQANKGKIVAFTFTNAAADEMYQRLGMEQSDQLFIGTIHKYCCNLLLGYGITKVLDYLEEEWFDRVFRLIVESNIHPEPVYCIICDEFQDCNKEQFEFLFEILRSQKYFCCGDPRQCIYRWRGSEPALIEEYAERLRATRLILNENYRNGRDILDFAKAIIRMSGAEYKDNSIAMRDTRGLIHQVPYNLENIAKGLQEYEGSYSDWFILTRTNEQLQEVFDFLTDKGIPCDSFRRTDLSYNEVRERMAKNTVKVMTIHSGKGLEAKNVLVIGARFFNVEEKCVSYVAATRARDYLVWVNVVPKKARPKPKFKSWEKF